MHKKGNYLVIMIVVVIIILLLLFFLRVPFDSFLFNSPDVACENGVLKQGTSGSILASVLKINELSNLNGALQCAISANGDESVSSQVVCINNQPTVVCKTQLYKAILMGRIKFINVDSVSSPQNTKTSKNPSNFKALCMKACGGELKLDGGGPEAGVGYAYSQSNNMLSCACSDGSYQII